MQKNEPLPRLTIGKLCLRHGLQSPPELFMREVAVVQIPNHFMRCVFAYSLVY
jgi:hypothetical protein